MLKRKETERRGRIAEDERGVEDTEICLISFVILENGCKKLKNRKRKKKKFPY